MSQVEDGDEGLGAPLPAAGSSGAAAAGSRFKYTPVNVRRKAVFGNTMTVSEGTLGMMLLGNSSIPLGYESHDMGLARYAP